MPLDLPPVDSEKVEDGIFGLCCRFKLKRSEISVVGFHNVRDDTTGDVFFRITISKGTFLYTLHGSCFSKSKMSQSSKKRRPQSIMEIQRAILKKRNAKAKLDPLHWLM
jgi:hypothetical protein